MDEERDRERRGAGEAGRTERKWKDDGGKEREQGALSALMDSSDPPFASD